ncbi:galactose-1-phosphate uridylyltransferase, partial [bacterium]|nr:galactose-1-phosphate uridylyltransferase [bacterium]
MPELRFEPIAGRWIIFSTNRNNRPTDFLTSSLKFNDGICPFCAGNEAKTPPELYSLRHNNSAPDTPGWEARVVPNKFPAVKKYNYRKFSEPNFYDKMNALGTHEVIIETPCHNKKMCSYTLNELNNVLQIYKKRFCVLKNNHDIKYILLFKNEGPLAGASLSHPHTQLIALPLIPNRVEDELNCALNYYNRHKSCVYCDMLNEEINIGERVVYENQKFVSFCPYASRFPYEIWILPKKHGHYFKNISIDETGALSDMLIRILKKLFFALKNPQYNLIIRSAPVNLDNKAQYGQIGSYIHWHIEI